VLFSEPKIPQGQHNVGSVLALYVSVLFSEPKIPQVIKHAARHHYPLGFSALQRAENSSSAEAVALVDVWRRFQCSSASRKFLKRSATARRGIRRDGFSALQRAENSSSICSRPNRRAVETRFQCSSASRKFLKGIVTSSPSFAPMVSVLFSEPKIPQAGCSGRYWTARVSVLFSEPKIPQASHIICSRPNRRGFSALQRAENSSRVGVCSRNGGADAFQCSSASRKFLKVVVYERNRFR